MAITTDDLYDIARAQLTDYNDNFVGEPCTEILDEVVGYVTDHRISYEQAEEAISDIIHNLYD